MPVTASAINASLYSSTKVISFSTKSFKAISLFIISISDFCSDREGTGIFSLINFLGFNGRFLPAAPIELVSKRKCPSEIVKKEIQVK
ncbi:hypothetical protein NBRC110019_15510 [Neptunitalea chrysea]|uniref:Uncharacterized protein n=1 Tax=Neptunitalea chrysea TaxID=1647581 RepID=A0A9W6B4R0_9FLAO|nr:hypothetical protein NBRC110019_15510 [Neptunitalea chrysea]